MYTQRMIVAFLVIASMVAISRGRWNGCHHPETEEHHEDQTVKCCSQVGGEKMNVYPAPENSYCAVSGPDREDVDQDFKNCCAKAGLAFAD